MPAKTVLRRIGYSEGWSRVVFEGEVVCYLSSRYLTLNVPQNDPTGIYYPGHGQYASKIIVIDAGHQNYAMNDTEPNGPGSSVMKFKLSSGTVGVATGVWEHELNLEVALMLRDLLLERGYTVIMIRETGNVTISNAERAQIANKYPVSYTHLKYLFFQNSLLSASHRLHIWSRGKYRLRSEDTPPARKPTD